MDTPTFITFMVMWMLLLFGILGIVLTYRHNRHLVDLVHKERMHALESGLDMAALPPRANVPGAQGHVVPATHHLHRGLIFTLLGLSLMAAFGVNAGIKSALWGLPVTAIGIAYLILYFVGNSTEQRP